MTTVGMENNKDDLFGHVIREAGYRRCIILHGNVRDLFDDGKKHYVPLSEALQIRLEAMRKDGQACFTISGRWDHVDGFIFPNSVMQQTFQRALRCPASGTTSRPCPASSPETEYDDGGRDTQTTVATDQASDGIFKQPQEAFATMRRVLSDSTERAVFILDWQQYLVGNPAHQDLAERQLLTILAKAVAEQPVGQTGSDALKGPTGLLVIITSSLGNLPVSLYKDNARTKVITVSKPDRPQRLAFLAQNQRDLQVTEPKAAPGQPSSRYSSCDAILSQMAELSDDLTIVDLQNLLALSRQLPTKVRPDRLVNLYRFGKQHSPWEDLDDRKLDGVAEQLKKRVMGQDHAISAVETMVRSAYMGLGGTHDSSKNRQPKGKMFCVGPTGTGKTELAKALAEFLFGDESACIRFDMSEYSHEHDDLRLVGAPPSYVGYEQGGQLTNAVRERPFSVLLFDEIEKAHGRLFDKFLQIFEDGRLTDGQGQTVFFNESIVIFTSNIGTDGGKGPDLDPAAHEAYFKERVISYFAAPPRADGRGGLGRPELVDRIEEDNIIVFNYVTDPDIRKKILLGKLAALKEDLHERYGMQLKVSDACMNWLESRSRTGIIRRDITNVVKRYFSKNRLANFAYERRHQLRPGRILVADVPARGDDIVFEIREGGQNDAKEEQIS
jgi:hypothetical protein